MPFDDEGAGGNAGPVRLDLGAGGHHIEGFTPVDRKLGTEVYPLANEDGTVDEIRASHVLEHFSHREASAVVNHWVEKLKPGGRLRIAVPDFEWIAKKYLAGEPVNVQGYVMGGHVDADDHHGALFDRESLTEVMINAGLERIGSWKSHQADAASLEVSLNLEGYKPAGPTERLRGVTAVLSAPRYGPVMHAACALRAFHALGMPHFIGQGAYWHQILAELIEEQLKAGAHFVLTLDYDTVFEAADVRELYRLMQAEPKADAVCAMQMKRQDDHPLMWLEKKEGGLASEMYRADLNRSLLQIAYGHFGCTLFRASALQKLPRPWFMPAPNAEGRWGGARTDADMAFWKAWKAAGLTAFVAPRVAVGHLAEVILWPSDDLKPIFQTAPQYDEVGVPQGVRR